MGENEYWRTLLDKLTLTSIQLPDDAIYVPLGSKTPIGKPGWGSMLSVVDRNLAPVPWEDLDSAMVQEIQRESSGFTLDARNITYDLETPWRLLLGETSTSCLTLLSPTPPALYLILM